GREPDRRRRGSSRRLVADPRRDPRRRPERHPRGGPGRRLPAPPARPDGLVAAIGPPHLRRAARQLPPVPGPRRVLRQRRHGLNLWLHLPAVASDNTPRGRPLADRRGRVRRLHPPGRARELAAELTRTLLRGLGRYG